jgi:hypothetical protein
MRVESGHEVCVLICQGNGFEPPPDFPAAAGHLGGWAETSAITSGRDATPFYVAGPYDNPRAIIRILDRVCGQGNYEYLVPAGSADRNVSSSSTVSTSGCTRSCSASGRRSSTAARCPQPDPDLR